MGGIARVSHVDPPADPPMIMQSSLPPNAIVRSFEGDHVLLTKRDSQSNRVDMVPSSGLQARQLARLARLVSYFPVRPAVGSPKLTQGIVLL